MKKLIALLLTFCLVLSLGAFSVSAEDAKLDKTGWTVEASSEHQNSAPKAIDGNVKSYWHSYFSAEGTTIVNKAAPPHELKITLPESTVISGFSYVPRTGESSTGRVLKYEFYGADLSDNMTLIASGEFANDETEKVIRFENNVEVKSVLFKMTETVAVSGVVAELDLFREDSSLSKKALSEISSITINSEVNKTEDKPKEEKPAVTQPATGERKVEGEVPVDPRYVDKNGWTAYAEQSFPTGAERAEKSIDGNPNSYWHSYFKAVDGVNQKAPMPYDMIYTLPSLTTVSGFCYLPRQTAGSTSGRVLGYELYASADDSENWVKLAEGEFTNDGAAKDVHFVCNVDVKKIMFRVTSGLNGYAVIGEFDLMVKREGIDTVPLSVYEAYAEENTVNYIDVGGIAAESSSEWTGHAALRAFDGNLGSYWHKVPEDKGMILLRVDLGKEYEVAGFTYYPRRDDIKGHWKKYTMYASVDDNEYIPVLTNATFDTVDFTSKDVRFTEPVKMRYVEFEIEEYHGHCAAAEIGFYQTGEAVKEEKVTEKYVLQIDNPVIKSEINGVAKETPLDVSPFIKNSNTMIPLRGLLEEMGASIEWNGENQSIIVKKGLITIDMQIKRRQVYVTRAKGTVRYAFRTSPIIKDSRTFIPLRFISENLGYNVAWDGETRTITITTPEEE